MNNLPRPERVLVTGASGFVGRHVVRELISRGYGTVCLVRDAEKLRRCLPQDVPDGSVSIVEGDLDDAKALDRAARQAQATIHLVGIIFDRPMRGQTFDRIHVQGTRHVLEASQRAGIRRFVHMSALGTRPDAVSEYHRTKYKAETIIRNCGLKWTIFRPSIIHGADGEFMSLMKTFVAKMFVPAMGFIPLPFPVIPYFGGGENKLQPIAVQDVATCFVKGLDMPETFGQFYAMGGPKACSWKQLYATCRDRIPRAYKSKPIVGMPVFVAKLLARTVMRTPLLPLALRFNVSQVQMSQEDSVCDTAPLENTFGVKLRDFEFELSQYADRIR
jgi:NADH dehydrogenase